MRGLEPPHPKALPPEDSVSTNFTTCARKNLLFSNILRKPVLNDLRLAQPVFPQYDDAQPYGPIHHP